MGLPVEIDPLLLASKTSAYSVSKSLRFRSSASAYLNRTPASAGSQTTWTWSAWVKRGSLGGTMSLFHAGASTANECMVMLDSDSLRLYNDTSSTTNMNLVSTAVYRDPSAWYHFLVVYNSTQATSTNRVSMYVNGVQITSFSTSTYPAQNQTSYINSNIAHQLGERQPSADLIFDGYLAEVNFIDGQALAASSFGAYDTNGVWQPIKYSGTYGTNGFYLPFSSTTSAGFSSYYGTFNGSSQYLSIASATPIAFGTSSFTVEGWVYPTSFSNAPFIVGGTGTAGQFGLTTSGALTINLAGTGTLGTSTNTLQLNQWQHVAYVRNGTTVSFYINGVNAGGSFTSSASFGGSSTNIGTTNNQTTAVDFSGNLSNIRLNNGTAVYTANFTPPQSALTAISGTTLLTLQNATIVDNSTNAFTITNTGSVAMTSATVGLYWTIANDASGNSNNWTTNNISLTAGSTYDSMNDSPTVTSATVANYAVLNPIGVPYNTGTAAGGNLNWTGASTADKGMAATISMSSGKWYWECTVTATGAGSNSYVGIVKTAGTADSNANRVYYRGDGATVKYGTATTGLATYTTGDVIGIAYDYSAQTLAFYKNNTLVTTVTSINLEPYLPWVGSYTTTESWAFNAGQRPFSYSAPTGYSALNTYNLPTPTIANGAQYMAATTYTGTGATQTISDGTNTAIGTTFQPDLVWIKSRSAATNNNLFDVLRGTTAYLSSNNTSAEATNANTLTAFGSTGFTVGSDASSIGVNVNAATYVGWQWKANGAGVTNTNGSITSTVSANTTAGFGIVTYTGTGANATIGHGLGVAPNMIITKSRNLGGSHWTVYHSSVGNTGALLLDTTAATNTSINYWNNTSPTSSVFSVGINGSVNNSGNTFVAYCWAAVPGYSAFGSYTGNGSTDGPFVYTGFRPRFIIAKDATNIDSASWMMQDSSRDTYNVGYKSLYANDPSVESVSSNDNVDILSNGFKIRNASSAWNNSGQTFIYAAFAENPFNSSRAR